MKYPETNLNLYKTFVAAYETQSYSRASVELGTTQPNVTHSIKDLEQQLGVKLFFAGPRGVRATHEADVLYKQVFEAFDKINNGEESVKGFDVQSSGVVRIGCPSHFASGIILDSFLKFTDKYPNISFDFYNDSVPTLIEMLKKQSVDVLLLTSKSTLSVGNDYIKKDIMKLEYSFAASDGFLKKHGLDACIPLENFRTLPMIIHKTSSRYQEMIAKYNLNATKEFKTPTVELAYQFMLEGLGIGCFLNDFLDKALEKERFQKVTVTGLAPSDRTLVCIYNKKITDKRVLSFVNSL